MFTVAAGENDPSFGSIGTERGIIVPLHARSYYGYASDNKGGKKSRITLHRNARGRYRSGVLGASGQPGLRDARLVGSQVYASIARKVFAFPRQRASGLSLPSPPWARCHGPAVVMRPTRALTTLARKSHKHARRRIHARWGRDAKRREAVLPPAGDRVTWPPGRVAARSARAVLSRERRTQHQSETSRETGRRSHSLPVSACFLPPSLRLSLPFLSLSVPSVFLLLSLFFFFPRFYCASYQRSSPFDRRLPRAIQPPPRVLGFASVFDRAKKRTAASLEWSATCSASQRPQGAPVCIYSANTITLVAACHTARQSSLLGFDTTERKVFVGDRTSRVAPADRIPSSGVLLILWIATVVF